MIAVELCHVTKTIKGHSVISDVNLSVEKGTVVGIRGVNGSGKTMLLRLIAGLVKPSKGEIQVQGAPIDRKRGFPESIGLLIENPAFLENYSGLENLKLLASIQGKTSHGQIDKTLADVGLTEAGNKKYKKYSLGMKQRLGIAAAIMECPELILLDEPTNALDDDGIIMAQNIIEREKKRGATVLVACHDKDFLLRVADEIVYLEESRVVRIENLERVQI